MNKELRNKIKAYLEYQNEVYAPLPKTALDVNQFDTTQFSLIEESSVPKFTKIQITPHSITEEVIDEVIVPAPSTEKLDELYDDVDEIQETITDEHISEEELPTVDLAKNPQKNVITEDILKKQMELNRKAALEENENSDEETNYIETSFDLFGTASPIDEKPSPPSLFDQENDLIADSSKHDYQVDTKKKEPDLQELLNNCCNLDELRELCENKSDVLKTDLENTNLVFGVGNEQAKLMIIGEAPGEMEDELGEPFVGKAGQLLDKILKAIDLDRKTVYIANILKHRPPSNRDPLPEERTRSLPFLIRQIEIIQPKLILCLGRISAKTLLNLPEGTTLKELRGKFHPFMNGIELTATYHPAALLRNQHWKRPTWEDVKMVKVRYDQV